MGSESDRPDPPERAPRRGRPPRNDPDTVSREVWLAAAREVLIKEGVTAVTVDRLARDLGVTRGGFYWRFKGRSDLLDALLIDWREMNTRSMLQALAGPGSPAERYVSLMRIWIDEQGFSPAYDRAVRDWARVSDRAAKALNEFDEACMDALRELFLQAGCDAEEALIRARISYYHQVGYYALGVKQTREERHRLANTYLRLLTGFSDASFSD